MAGNKIICTTHEVSYIDIRNAMCEGVRTVEELIEKTGAKNFEDAFVKIATGGEL